jgi:hypothetical protein
MASLLKSRPVWIGTIVVGVGLVLLWYLTHSLRKPDQLSQADMAMLTTFVNKDLRNLDDSARGGLAGLLARILPDKYSVQFNNPYSFQPWYLWRFDTRFVLFEGQPLFEIPGVSSAGIHFLDETGRHMGCSVFSTGWRIDLKSARLLNETPVGAPVIEILTERAINGLDIHHQYYGVLDNRVVLLRLEDSEGRFVDYLPHRTNHTIGPEAPSRLPAEWEQGLLSSDPVRVLEVLTWLGGFHPDDLTSRPVNDNDAGRHFVEVWRRPGVQKAILGLSTSKNKWIREAAIGVRERIEN